MRKNSSSYDGKGQGELYSPEYAIHINTAEEDEKEQVKELKAEKLMERGQGDLYSPQSALHISASQGKKHDHDEHHVKVKEAEAKSRKGKDEEEEEETSQKQRTESLGKPSSKL